MVYESLIAIVESHLDNLTDTWVQEVKKSEYLETYKQLNDTNLYSRGNILFSNLQSWLLKGASNDDAATYFREIGIKRIKEGFPITEVYYALYLEKKVLWSFVTWKDEVSGILKAVDAIEFMTVINNYFDLGEFWIIKGYINEMFEHLSKSDKFNKNELETKFINGALFLESKKVIREKMFSEGLNVDLIK